MKKRLFAIALSLCMTLSLLPTAAFAAGEGASTGSLSGSLWREGRQNLSTDVYVYGDITHDYQGTKFYAGGLSG